MPTVIAAECGELKALSVETQGSRLNLFRCPMCPFTCASSQREAPRCRECRQLMAIQARGTDHFNEERYFANVRERPDAFFGEATLKSEVADRIARKRVQ